MFTLLCFILFEKNNGANNLAQLKIHSTRSPLSPFPALRTLPGLKTEAPNSQQKPGFVGHLRPAAANVFLRPPLQCRRNGVVWQTPSPSHPSAQIQSPPKNARSHRNTTSSSRSSSPPPSVPKFWKKRCFSRGKSSTRRKTRMLTPEIRILATCFLFPNYKT